MTEERLRRKMVDRLHAQRSEKTCHDLVLNNGDVLISLFVRRVVLRSIWLQEVSRANLVRVLSAKLVALQIAREQFLAIGRTLLPREPMFGAQLHHFPA